MLIFILANQMLLQPEFYFVLLQNGKEECGNKISEGLEETRGCFLLSTLPADYSHFLSDRLLLHVYIFCKIIS